MIDNQRNDTNEKCKSLQQLIELAVDSVSSAADFSEREYQTVLGELRSRSKRAAQAIVADYESLPYSDYLARWCRLQLLADLGEPASLAFLGRFLSHSTPSTPLSVGVRAQETILSTTAIEAIARMAADGCPEALPILQTQRKNPSLFVRRAAARTAHRLTTVPGGNTVPLNPLKPFQLQG